MREFLNSCTTLYPSLVGGATETRMGVKTQNILISGARKVHLWTRGTYGLKFILSQNY